MVAWINFAQYAQLAWFFRRFYSLGMKGRFFISIIAAVYSQLSFQPRYPVKDIIHNHSVYGPDENPAETTPSP